MASNSSNKGKKKTSTTTGKRIIRKTTKSKKKDAEALFITPSTVKKIKEKKAAIIKEVIGPALTAAIALEELFSSNPSTKKVRRKISRRKPGSIGKIINYFDATTQASIVLYQNELDTEAKKKIYVSAILPAFDSLVENLINVYGFQVMHESKVDLKNECLEFLYNAVGKFNPEKGSKAFSYFNVVAKNWLTIKSKQNAKKVQTYISIDNKDDISPEDLEIIENYRVMPSYDDMVMSIETHDQLLKLVDAIGERTKTDNERATIDAVKMVMRNLDELDLLSKRAILNYIREISGLSPKSLSISVSSIKKYYRELRKTDEFSRN